jgi:DNA recombination protein RmuC
MESYNKAVTSINTRLLPSARKLKELSGTTGADLEPLEPQDATPRALELPEQPTPEA